MGVEVQEILKNIMKQEQCSPIYALFILAHIQDNLREEDENVRELQYKSS